MELKDQFFAAPNLEIAVDRQPLIISPGTTLREAIVLMSEARGSSCRLDAEATDLEPNSDGKTRSSCVIVREGSKLRGILTERDIVKLTAAKIEFDAVTVDKVMTQPVVTLTESSFQDIFAALFLFRRYRIRHLPLVDAENNLIGVISPETIRQAMRPANLLKIRRVADVMSKNLIHASRNTSILNLAQLMTQHRVSCVVITEVDTDRDAIAPLGIVTERDILQFQSLRLNLSKIVAQEVMSSPLLLLSPEDSLLTAHQEMQRKRVRRLVVSWNWGKGLGIVTQTSLLRIFDPMEMYGVIETLQNTIKQLEQDKANLLAAISSDYPKK